MSSSNFSLDCSPCRIVYSRETKSCDNEKQRNGGTHCERDDLDDGCWFAWKEVCYCVQLRESERHRGVTIYIHRKGLSPSTGRSFSQTRPQTPRVAPNPVRKIQNRSEDQEFREIQPNRCFRKVASHDQTAIFRYQSQSCLGSSTRERSGCLA